MLSFSTEMCLVTESHLVVPLQLVIVPGGDEDVHRVPDHGDVDRLVAVPHPLTDQVVFEPASYFLARTARLKLTLP